MKLQGGTGWGGAQVSAPRPSLPNTPREMTEGDMTDLVTFVSTLHQPLGVASRWTGLGFYCH